ncbi:hypothetical protein [Streptomyces sp. NPDC088794]|uniref:hypothetical protein n=1 Tax=Streptomyces sp. NPDC088794 TaxID=3365902 RepID=UPI003819374B
MPPSEQTGTIPVWLNDYVASKPFMDAVRKVVDAKWLADNLPVTGAKAEVAGVKAEANAASLSVFGVQTEYSLFKAEAAAFDLNKFLDSRAQERRDKDQDDRLHGLSVDAVRAKDLIDKVKQDLKSTADSLRRTLSEGDKKLRGEVPQLRTSVNDLRRRLLDADQVLRDRISKLQAKVGQVSTVAHNADVRSKDEKARVKELDKEVRAGLRQVQALQGSAKGASRDIGILIDRVTALERALR